MEILILKARCFLICKRRSADSKTLEENEKETDVGVESVDVGLLVGFVLLVRLQLSVRSFEVP